MRNPLSSENPEVKTFDELIKELKAHYSIQNLELTSWFRFNRRSQNDEESAKDFIVALQSLANNCSFGEFTNQALRDRLVAGLRKEDICKKLLYQPNLSFELACKLIADTEDHQSRNVEQTPVTELKESSSKRCIVVVGVNHTFKKTAQLHYVNV